MASALQRRVFPAIECEFSSHDKVSEQTLTDGEILKPNQTLMMTLLRK